MAAIVASQIAIFSIESAAYPGYNLTQLGTQVLLAKANKDDPKQLWYRDDSWQFIDSFALINMESKKALKAPPNSLQKATIGTYDPAVAENPLLWYASAPDGSVTWLNSRSLGTYGALGVGVSRNKVPDGIPAIVGSNAAGWKFNLYAPRSFKIQCSWVNQLLAYKPPYETVKYVGMPSAQTDENNVVGIHPDEASGDVRNREVWYRIPAGGQEDTNNYTSFIIIIKSTGLALKGSSKPGEKVLAVEFNPLDYDFVWAEDRAKAGDTNTFVNINLSRSGSTNLFWYLPEDSSYQNVAWYHPLTVSSSARTLTWKFIPADVPPQA